MPILERNQGFFVPAPAKCQGQWLEDHLLHVELDPLQATSLVNPQRDDPEDRGRGSLPQQMHYCHSYIVTMAARPCCMTSSEIDIS